MSSTNDLREFLTARRARITPEQAGLPAYGSKRRVAGLRREEAALLAGISVEYYTQLERGNARGASDDVLAGIARALQLDEAEEVHFRRLVRSARTSQPERRRPSADRVRPNVQRVLDLLGTPAFLRNGRLDVLSMTRLGYALYSEVFVDRQRPANLARFIFLNPRSAHFYVNWENMANEAVGTLRAEAGRDPYDRRLTDLIGELSTRSEAFRIRWAAHVVREYRSGTQEFHHPRVGDLTLAYEALHLAGDPGQVIITYTAEPGTPAQAALDLLSAPAASPGDPARDEPPTGDRT